MPALPSGTILGWSGSIASIPAGYVLCDGNNGTPDLRDRMIIGAGGGFAVGANGGNINHNHTFTGDGHGHSLRAGIAVAGGAFWSASTTSDPASGTTDNTNHLPPYYALAWIMKT